MNPTSFKQATNTFTKPEGMAECGDLPTFIDPENGQIISKWEAPLWSRIKFLFHGTIWLGVLSSGMPPVWLDCTKTVFLNEEPGSFMWRKFIDEIFSTLISLGLSYLILWGLTGESNPQEWTILTKILSATFLVYAIRRLIIENYTENA